MKTANLALKFLLELAALAAFAIWGAGSESGGLAGAHAIIAPLIVALLWGRLTAPRSRHRLPRATRIPFELSVFVLAAVALLAAGPPPPPRPPPRPGGVLFRGPCARPPRRGCALPPGGRGEGGPKTMRGSP